MNLVMSSEILLTGKRLVTELALEPNLLMKDSVMESETSLTFEHLPTLATDITPHCGVGEFMFF